MINPTETQIQTALFDWASYHPILRRFLIHIPNERKCTPAQGLKFKRLGVKKGVSDLFLAYPRSPYHGLWIELKRNKKSKVTEDQFFWLTRMNGEGYKAEVAYGFEHAKKIIEEYLNV